MAATNAKSERIRLRVSGDQREAIEGAAEASNQSLSEFVIDAAIERANTVLVDRSGFELNGKAWDRFQQALDRPAVARPALTEFLGEPAVLEQP